jgi:hypothetical protein
VSPPLGYAQGANVIVVDPDVRDLLVLGRVLPDHDHACGAVVARERRSYV